MERDAVRGRVGVWHDIWNGVNSKAARFLEPLGVSQVEAAGRMNEVACQGKLPVYMYMSPSFLP